MAVISRLVTLKPAEGETWWREARPVPCGLLLARTVSPTPGQAEHAGMRRRHTCAGERRLYIVLLVQVRAGGLQPDREWDPAHGGHEQAGRARGCCDSKLCASGGVAEEQERNLCAALPEAAAAGCKPA